MKLPSKGPGDVILISISIITILTIIASVEAETFNVCSRGCDYSSLQEAINAASEGDIIFVQSGIYSETINLDKRLILRGVDTGDGKPLFIGDNSIITIYANRSIIDGFNFSGSQEAGIKVLSWGNTLLENDISQNAIGISVQFGENILTRNNILYNDLGIALTSASENILTFNNISYNLMGVVFRSSMANIVRENFVSQNANYGMVYQGSDFNILIGNLMRDNFQEISLNESYNNSLLRNIFTGDPLVGVHESSLNCWEGNSYRTSNMGMGNGSFNEENASSQKGDILSFYSNMSVRSGAKSLSPDDAYALIENNPSLMIIDIRTPQEYQGGHLAGAINLDYYSYGFLDGLKSLDKDRTCIIYCKRGVRGGVAFEMMMALGFKEVYNIRGGITQWAQERKPLMGKVI